MWTMQNNSTDHAAELLPGNLSVTLCRRAACNGNISTLPNSNQPRRQSTRDRLVLQRKRTTNAPSAKKQKLKAANQGVQKEARYVVGLDFGTTCSGFAFASMDDPDKVFTFENWPCKGEAGASRYGKTQTSLRYLPPGQAVRPFLLQDWGWRAYVNHCEDVQERGLNANCNTPVPFFFTNFKLHLGSYGDSANYTNKFTPQKLPDGLSTERLIADYLRQLSRFALEEVRTRFGSFIQKRDIKWCLTVPSVWTHSAKRTMRECSEMGGLVSGPQCRDEDASLEKNFAIALEPEAASVYCLQKFKDSHELKMGSKVLVVDAGGGTVDLVVHELIDDSGLRLREVSTSTGDLCGGTFVDTAFMDYLAGKIPCFEQFRAEEPTTMLDILGKWEGIKYSFDQGQKRHFLPLPWKLGDAWETYIVDHEPWNGARQQVDQVVITREDMKAIFDGQVNKILKLIGDQLVRVPEMKAIFVVGGFSNSPYLMDRIHANFSHYVNSMILSPVDSESAVSRGATIIGTLGVDIMMSRKSRKTYGVAMHRLFHKGDPPRSNVIGENGEALCKDAFDVFIRIGDDVPVNHCVREQYFPLSRKEPDIKFTMYATSDPYPEYVTDKGVEKVDSWTYRLPPEALKMQRDPSVQVAMYFGRTHIQVAAQPMNFRGGEKSMFSVLFDRELVEDVL